MVLAVHSSAPIASAFPAFAGAPIRLRLSEEVSIDASAFASAIAAEAEKQKHAAPLPHGADVPLFGWGSDSGI